MAHPPQPSLRRRLLMPVVILFVGGLIAAWGVQREQRRVADIRTQVHQLLHDVSTGKATPAQVNPTNLAMARQILDVLHDMCASPDDVALLEVDITSGDARNIGSIGQPASHTALIKVGDHVVVGLRILHRGFDKPIVILGYWIPKEK